MAIREGVSLLTCQPELKLMMLGRFWQGVRPPNGRIVSWEDADARRCLNNLPSDLFARVSHNEHGVVV